MSCFLKKCDDFFCISCTIQSKFFCAISTTTWIFPSISAFLNLFQKFGLIGKLVIQRLDSGAELLFFGVGKGSHFHAPLPQVLFAAGFPLGQSRRSVRADSRAQVRKTSGKDGSTAFSFSMAAALAS